jgi:hypothetical protein
LHSTYRPKKAQKKLEAGPTISARFHLGQEVQEFEAFAAISIKIKQHEMRNDMSLCVLSGPASLSLAWLSPKRFCFVCFVWPDSCAKKKPFNHFSVDGFFLGMLVEFLRLVTK